MSKLVDLRSSGRYKPDVKGLACGKIVATKARLGLTDDEFAQELSGLLSWAPSPGLIRSWERATAAPPGDVLAACDVLSPPDSSTRTDEIAIAASQAESDRANLLAEPAPSVLATLWDELLQSAGGSHRTPRETFRAVRDIRFRALGVAEQTRRPSTLTDLYLVTSASAALMASAAFDLHRWDASERLCQSAISYAEMIGNNSLLAWATGLAATLANWRDEPDAALNYFHRGMAVAPAGVPRVRLRYIAARSYALIGDVDAVRSLVNDAHDDHAASNNHRDLVTDEVGGEFDFGTARAAACLAAAWLDLGQGQEAADAAQWAVGNLTTLPVSRQPTSQVLGARIDLATAHVMCDEIDGAEEIITSVSAENMLRNTSLAGRLTRTHAALTSRASQGSLAARHLSEAVRALITYQSADSEFGVPNQE